MPFARFRRPRPLASGLLVLLVLILLLPIACKRKAAEDAEAANGESAVTVQAEHPTVGPIAEEISGDAILAPLAQAALAARTSAPIRAEYVERGAHVRKGQLLLTLEDRDLQGAALDSRGSLTQAEAAYTATTQATLPEELEKAQVEVTQARANLEVANRTAEERRRLLQEGAIAGRDTDAAVAAAVQAQAAYDTAVQHLAGIQATTGRTGKETAQGQLRSARGRLQSAEAQVSYASLRSPIDGVVTERPLFPGETASAGTPVITVMDTSALLAKLHLAQAAAQKLRLGDPAELHIPGVGDPLPAVVNFLSPALDPGSTTVEVWLKLANPQGQYKVGTPVHAVIRGYPVPQAVQLPVAALLPAEDGGTEVLVVSPEGTVHKRAVRVGLRTETRVQILEGVAPSDNVVTEGGYGLEEGAKVTLGAGPGPRSGSEPEPEPTRGKAGGAAGSTPSSGSQR